MMKMLNNEEARRLLQTARVARLGCIVKSEPYVVPINRVANRSKLNTWKINNAMAVSKRERKSKRNEKVNAPGRERRAPKRWGCWEQIAAQIYRARFIRLSLRKRNLLQTATMLPASQIKHEGDSKQR